MMALSRAVLVSLSAGIVAAQDVPGKRADGSILLPNGWAIEPLGRQIQLDSDLPVRTAFDPGGRFLLVQHCGYRAHGITVVETGTGKVVNEIELGKSWSGFAFGNGGKTLFASGGVDDVVYAYPFDPDTGKTGAGRTIAVGDAAVLDLPAGMCTDGVGRLWVVLQRSHQLVRIEGDKVSLTVALPGSSFPFECTASPDGAAIWVSLWGSREVRSYDAASGEALYTIAAGEHPSELLFAPDGKRLFVSNGNENTVSVIDLEKQRVSETISSALWPSAPPGSTPDSLALTKGGALLLVANADNNDCAVIDVSEPGEAKSLGFLPLGCYPTSIRIHPGTGKVWACNGKGSTGSHGNPEGPQPGKKHGMADYTGSMFAGSLSVFEFPRPDELQKHSARVRALAPLAADAGVRGVADWPADSPIPKKRGDATPITHCVYVIKENRTYDQMLGDDARGNGAVDLCLFGAEVTPNHHAVVKQWPLLDNFYVDGEVSADGHEWTMGAYATDFVERTWPVTYGGKGHVKVEGGRPHDLGFPAEGAYALATPKNGYLWDLAAAAGVSYRSYGEFVANAGDPKEPGTPKLPVLVDHIDPLFRSFDLDYPDQKRADRFLAQLAEYEQKGELPRLIVLRLPNDHTAGTKRGAPTPRAFVADNDLALGRVLEGLSRSRFWKGMAVFVIEDDAQNGPDHVDAHRSICLLAGPYVRRGSVIKTMYTTCSVLRTIELILGLPPMSQFDAAARPMVDCFTGKPDLLPFQAKPAAWPLDEKNARTAWAGEQAGKMDFATEDAADDVLLNEMVWKTVKGADSPMPAPRRAAFLRTFER